MVAQAQRSFNTKQQALHHRLVSSHIVSHNYNMTGYIRRSLEQQIRARLLDFPAVAILGPRQVGKSTLAKRLVNEINNSLYLDLEKPADRNKLSDPYAFLSAHNKSLVCLDEIQRVPELFPVLRVLIDEHDRAGRFLILGSASRDLIRQGSESLAGRLAYMELTPFHAAELKKEDLLQLDVLRLRGGFPRSWQAASDPSSLEWRSQFIRSFLERDIPQLSGSLIPAESMRRLWTMLAHHHGQNLNQSQLGASLGVSHNTVRKWMDLLQQTFVIRQLLSWSGNTMKRLVKSPKVYIRDTGLLHALLNIKSMDDLYAHPVYGPSWEGFVIEQFLSHAPHWQPSFYRTRNGAEIDLVLEYGQQTIAIEIKASTAPTLAKGAHTAVEDLNPDQFWIIAPVNDSYPLRNGATVFPIIEALERLSDL